MSIAADAAIAFGAGLASFASPCVLPLLPAYLAVVGALDHTHRQPTGPAGGPTKTAATAVALPRRSAKAVSIDTALFVAGFSAVFVLLGLSASSLGHALIANQVTLTKISGLVILAMGLYLAGSLILRTPSLYGEWRPHPPLRRLRRAAAPAAGAAFALGWTPCVGPVLASILALAGSQGHTVSAAALLAAYSAGLATPFIAAAVCFDRLHRPLGWLRRHGTAITACSAAALAGLGTLLAFDRLAWVTTQLQHL